MVGALHREMTKSAESSRRPKVDRRPVCSSSSEEHGEKFKKTTRNDDSDARPEVNAFGPIVLVKGPSSPLLALPPAARLRIIKRFLDILHCSQLGHNQSLLHILAVHQHNSALISVHVQRSCFRLHVALGFGPVEGVSPDLVFVVKIRNFKLR
jgi:hypothetical protein